MATGQVDKEEDESHQEQLEASKAHATTIGGHSSGTTSTLAQLILISHTPGKPPTQLSLPDDLE